ncbi:Histidine kinase-, DNA gyrase B-, and HSP90-like ATPase [Eubacterium uniforme]|uniref:histidine kinase n=1 Tax=Eubacterium uniforme TaxID=39495 RepID=A0A1T4VUL7_9FIRM|nr:HAMP domain-containing sensor histidine kinase [Eubacterium uniforme]SKA68637.1 Histidine kinase-, DNA gyrase B-, and HSP90-like ATPase [Eubacterium uniforme]
MIIVIIILIIICLLLVFANLKAKKSQESMAEQIKYINSTETNQLLHSEYGGVSENLINEINEVLKEKRSDSIYYQRKSHTIDQMITNISHDIRTPLTSAMGYINLVRNSDLDEKEKERELEVIEKRLHRMEELIEQFFEFSKVISKDEEIKKEDLNLIGVLEEAIAHYFDDFEAKNRMISLKYDSRKLVVHSNRGMLLRIFDNVISNALKHGEGELEVDVKSEDGKNVITFSNISKDDKLDVTQIFDEFYTTDISRTKGSTGLGLAIVKQFTNLLGGGIDANKEGDKFEIIISLRG